MEKEIEIWKPIEGYPNYEVSNFGNVKSLNYNRTGREKLLKLINDKDGYKTCLLCKNNTIKMCKVHRLVAEAFIPNPNNLPQVNHKDENKTNNHVNNLEWCTAKYNTNYGNRNKLVSKPIDVYDLDMDYIATYPSIRECERQLNADKSNIIKVCRGLIKQCNGYIFRYK
jgi:hypothetical protein